MCNTWVCVVCVVGSCGIFGGCWVYAPRTVRRFAGVSGGVIGKGEDGLLVW